MQSESVALKITLLDSCRTTIVEHGQRAFPEECCGTLVGRENPDGTRFICKVLPIENIKDENRERRYIIDPRAYLEAEKTARAEGLDLLGIYHSHPDHPSAASEFDRSHAMPFFSYIIVSIMKGTAGTMQSWRLRDDRSVFDEESLEFTGTLPTTKEGA